MAQLNKINDIINLLNNKPIRKYTILSYWKYFPA